MGACLLDRFTCRFTGKEAIRGLMRRWPCKSRVTYHSKGWLIFQFGSDDDRETVRQKGPFEIFGIPLVLQPMPENFEPNMEPEVNVPLWIRLVDLPLALWNFTAISKIASCFGTPLSTDFSTLRRESLDGPRVQVIINTALRPKANITVQLPNGSYEQKVEYEFFPSFCNACKIYGTLLMNAVEERWFMSNMNNTEPGHEQRAKIGQGASLGHTHFTVRSSLTKSGNTTVSPRMHDDGVDPGQQGAYDQLESGHVDPGEGQGGGADHHPKEEKEKQIER